MIANRPLLSKYIYTIYIPYEWLRISQKLGGVESTEDVTDSLISDVVSNLVHPTTMHSTEAEVMAKYTENVKPVAKDAA